MPNPFYVRVICRRKASWNNDPVESIPFFFSDRIVKSLGVIYSDPDPESAVFFATCRLFAMKLSTVAEQFEKHEGDLSSWAVGLPLFAIDHHEIQLGAHT